MDTPLYLRVRGRVLGPYDLEKLQLLVRRGQLSRMHEVSSDGANWVRASTYAELFAVAPMKLVAPEMAVASPPPAKQAMADQGIPQAEGGPGAASPGAAEGNSRGWYYEYLGSQQGPIDEPALRQMLAAGQLNGDSLVWNDGMRQWLPVAQVPGLVSVTVVNRGGQGGGEHSVESEDAMRGLCKAAAASRPWALFLAITAFIYAGLYALLGFLMLVNGADKGLPPIVAMGLFWMIGGAVIATGAILLMSYAGRLASLTYGQSSKVLESAMDRLKTFWMFVSIVLIVTLAFIAFFTIWVFAIGVSLPHYN